MDVSVQGLINSARDTCRQLGLANGWQLLLRSSPTSTCALMFNDQLSAKSFKIEMGNQSTNLIAPDETAVDVRSYVPHSVEVGTIDDE